MNKSSDIRNYYLLRLFILLFLPMAGFSQLTVLTKSAHEAFMVSRMINKFHIRPRPLNEAFSRDVFSKVLQQLDRQQVLFTKEDIASLSVYKLKLHDQIANRQTLFLENLVKVYASGLLRADTMIDNICRQPFNFYIPEKIIAGVIT